MRSDQIKKHLPLAVALFCVLFLNVYYRAFPIYFPQLKAQAKQIVDQNIQQAAASEVSKRFPQFYSLAKDEIVKNEIAAYRRQNAPQIKSQVNDIYAKLKDRFQDERGQTYLMELDCWHWSRYTENVLKSGHPGDEVIGGKQLDNFMLHPYGNFLDWNNFLFYCTAFLYKIFAVFKRVPLFTFTFYIPLFYIALFTLGLFFFVRSLGGGVAALVASLVVGLTPIFIPRSCAGWYDMDTLSMLMPILVVWVYALSHDRWGSLKKWILWSCFSGFLVGLFCFIWTSWWFIFLIIIMYELVSLAALYAISFYRKKSFLGAAKQHIASLSCFVFFSVVWVLVFCGVRPLAELFHIVTNALVLNKPLLPSIWPNVYATVGELRKASFSEIATAAAGAPVFWVSVLAMITLLARAFFSRQYSAYKRRVLFMLIIWFFSMLFATLRGVRFTMFLIAPLGMCLGWFVSESYSFIRSKQKMAADIFLAIALLIVSWQFMSKAGNVARGIYPLMDDNWYRVLVTIRDNSPADAVLNSWWDFGDWFKVVARRKVIFDGQSQNKPQAYWMAKAFLSGNEDEVMGILRMLNNGGNKAFELINEHIGEPLKSVLLLERILPLGPEEAKKILLEHLPFPAVNSVLELLYNRPPSAYFVVDPSLQHKISAISYIGNWNFAKVYIAQNINKREKDEILGYLMRLGRQEPEVAQMYQEAFLITSKNIEGWISRPYQFYGAMVGGQQKGNTVLFDNGFIYSINDQTIVTNAQQIPRSLFIEKEGHIVEVVFTNATLNFSCLVFKDETGYKLLLLERNLGNSFFVKLYFLNGRGLRHFKSFIDSQQGNDYLRVFLIDW